MKKLFLLLLAAALLLGCVQPGTEGTKEGAKEEIKDILELKEGYKYAYEFSATGESVSNYDIYVTKESDDYWKGIIAVAGEDDEGKKAVMTGFKISKRNNAIAFSKLLEPAQALDESLVYNVRPTETDTLHGPYEYFLTPFTMAALNSILGVDMEKFLEEGEVEVAEMGGTLTAYPTKFAGFEAYLIDAEALPKPFTIATVPPYLIINANMGAELFLTLKSVEKADFDPEAWADLEVVTDY